jgi:hypothetical protein
VLVISTYGKVALASATIDKIVSCPIMLEGGKHAIHIPIRYVFGRVGF